MSALEKQPSDELKGPTSDVPVLNAEQHDHALHLEAQPLSKKARLSDAITVCAAGAALISDGYQNNLMTMLNVVFGRLYKADYDSAMSTRVSNALLVGAILGQLTVGVVCDRIGRKAAIVMATGLIVLGGTLATAAHGMDNLGLLWMFLVARGITGFGVGAEYPASSTSASEAANEKYLKNRGPIFIMVTNFPLSFGGPLAVSVFLIVLSAAGENNLETVWRVATGVGLIFPLTVFYFRIRMNTTKLYARGAIKRRVPYWLMIKFYWKRIIGTAGSWWLYDFVVFPNGVFSGTIISSIVKDGSFKATGEYQLLLGALALPGIFVGAYLMTLPRIGRKGSMLIGFGGYLVIGLIIGCAYDQLANIVPLFVIFYGLLASFGNLGPGNQLGLLSSECYATPVRGTLYGFSAAFGKAGAAIGTQCFKPIQAYGKRYTFIASACVGVVGILVVWYFVPALTGDDLANEDARFQAYLTANGWEGEVGEDDDKHLVVANDHKINSSPDCASL